MAKSKTTATFEDDFDEEKKQAENTDLPTIIAQVIQRDNEDCNRKITPLC